MRGAVGRAWRAARRAGSVALLPLSVLPVAGAVPLVLNAHATYIRYYESPPLPAPKGDSLSAAERRAFVPLAPFTGAVPVLVYHGINNSRDGLSISRRKFASQMEMLRLAGFRTISIAQYNRFQRGDDAGLPDRPVLITFDGGRLDSFRAADRILVREGFQATMFIATGQIASRNPVYLDWTELHEMLRSGVWDIQPSAYQGDSQITVDRRGDERPFYAMRRYLRSTGEETFAEYERRVGDDLFTVAGQFYSQGIQVYALAVPYGDYGQLDPGNDPRLVPFTLGLMRSQFGTVFVENAADDPPYTTATGGGPQQRWEAHTATSPEQLYDWLRANDPGTRTSTSPVTGPKG